MENKKLSRKTKAGIITAILLASIGCAVLVATIARADPPSDPPLTVREFKGDINVSLSAVDSGTGVKFTRIAVYFQELAPTGETPWNWEELVPMTNYTGVLRFHDQGYYQIHFFSVDNFGNVEQEKRETVRIVIDNLAPTTTLLVEGEELPHGETP